MGKGRNRFQVGSFLPLSYGKNPAYQGKWLTGSPLSGSPGWQKMTWSIAPQSFPSLDFPSINGTSRSPRFPHVARDPDYHASTGLGYRLLHNIGQLRSCPHSAINSIVGIESEVEDCMLWYNHNEQDLRGTARPRRNFRSECLDQRIQPEIKVSVPNSHYKIFSCFMVSICAVLVRASGVLHYGLHIKSK